MRPLKMEISAFGPFAGREVLDFQELGERSFFLIHGPTGSGKTTILDAMCFALYGDTSGAERTGEQMCCGFSDGENLTEVIFEFSMGEKQYRVWRSPQRKRLKKRGDGFTVEQANAELFDLTGLADSPELGTAIAAGWTNVTGAVERILGFKSDQFRQVVMLPQGKFRQLLMADSRERQTILEVLFKTERYSRMEAYIKQEAKTLEEELRHKERAKTLLLAQAEVSTLAKLDEKIELAQKRLHQVDQEIEKLAISLKEEQRRVEEGQRAKEKLDDLRKAQSLFDQLEGKKGSMETLGQETMKSRQALELLPQEKMLQLCYRQRDLAEKDLVEWQKKLSQAQAHWQESQENLVRAEKNKPERAAAAARLAVLQDLMPRVKSLAEIKGQFNKVEKDQNMISDKLARVKKTMEELDQQRERAAEKVDQAKVAQNSLALIQRECQDAKTLHEKKMNLDQARESLENIQERFQAAEQETVKLEKRYEQMKNELEQLQELWNFGQASVLAATLREGISCPVCGSKDHPAPANPGVSLPSQGDLKKKKQEVEKAEGLLKEQGKEKEKLYGFLVQAEGKVQELAEVLGLNLQTDLAVLVNAMLKAEIILKETKETVESLPKLEGEMNTLDAKRREAQGDDDHLSAQLDAARAAVVGLQATVEERERDIPDNLRNPDGVKSEINEQEKKIQLLDQELEEARACFNQSESGMIAAQSGLTGAEKSFNQSFLKVQSEEESFAQNINAAGFTDREEYERFKRSEREVKEQEKYLQDYHSSVKSAVDWINRAQGAAEGLVEPNLAELIAAHEEAQRVNNQAIGERSSLDTGIKNQQSLRNSIHGFERALGQLEGRYRVVGRLSDVVNGKNSLGMTFQRFVLGALLDDVAISANDRLKMMSRNRYMLQRTLNRERSNAAGGLELEVIDNYTGLSRKVVTLSGGESFLASLALALGLAEVVQSYAGGIHLDTIFIDEGFGSLDPDALDYSIRVLIDLQKSGRLVGIISHIPELKERIDARLEVRSGERGSTAKFIFS